MDIANWSFIGSAIVAGIIYAVWAARWVLSQTEGEDALHGPYAAIREGADAFIRTQYRIITVAGIPIFLLLWIAPSLGPLTAIGFAIGGLCSAISGVIGMKVSVRANVRTAAAAKSGVAQALRVSLRAGSVTGFLVGGLALAAVSGFYLLLWNLKGAGPIDLRPMAGLGFGASLISIFARLGGGIFTKAADVGADLAGKAELGIPEDDPRNPAVIADNVGDNVGDCAGMAADVFESYAVTMVAAMLVAQWLVPGDMMAQQFPLALGAVGMLASLIGIQATKLSPNGSVLTAITRGLVASIILAIMGFYFVATWLMGASTAFSVHALFGTILTGLLVGLGMVITTNYYTGIRFSPVRLIAAASQSGHATNIITGLAIGMKSTVVPTLVIAVGIVASYALTGIYGIAIATCALLSLTPVIISVDAFGPVTDNAGGVVEMAGLSGDLREVTDDLDAAGNTTKALTKVFSIGSAGLAALALFEVFRLEVIGHSGSISFEIDNPYVLAGLFGGALLPFVFSGFAMDAVGGAASDLVQEVRRQFQEHPEILQSSRLPDYARAISMLTRASLRGMIIPGSLPVLVPLAVAFIWTPLAPSGSGAELMGGILIGAVGSGLVLAFFMSAGGAAWDNAKKYIEAGHYGGKGSPAHLAAITGDTVGDPCKDTAGPAINPMRKVLSMMAILLAPFMV